MVKRGWNGFSFGEIYGINSWFKHLSMSCINNCLKIYDYSKTPLSFVALNLTFMNTFKLAPTKPALLSTLLPKTPKKAARPTTSLQPPGPSPNRAIPRAQVKLSILNSHHYLIRATGVHKGYYQPLFIFRKFKVPIIAYRLKLI